MFLRLLLLLLPVLWGGSLPKGSSYRPKLKKLVIVQESLCVSVQCKFSWSGSPYLYWYKREGIKDVLLVATTDPEKELQERIQGRFLLPRHPKSKNCSLTIRDANMGDSGTYFLYLKYIFSEELHEDAVFTLKVTALTNKPEILIPGALESGRPKKLNCNVGWTCKEGTPPIFSWTSAAHSSLDLRSHPLSSMLTLTPRPQDHGTNLTCQVHFPATGVNVEKTIQLNVAYAPHNMAISIFQGNGTALKILQTTSLSIPEGQTLRLLCVADSNPPAELSWFWGLNATPISTSGILELPRVRPAQEGEFTCQAQHRLGFQTLSLNLSVVYPPQLLGPSCSWEDQGLHCSCSARAQPAPSLRWRLGAGLLEGNHGNGSHAVTSRSAGPWTNSSLSLCCEGLRKGLRLSCEARNEHGVQSASVLLLPDPPQLLGPSCSWEGQALHCSCFSRAQPAPSLRWRLGAGLMEGNHRNATHAVTSRSAGPWTNSSLSLHEGLSPDLRLSCEARNVLGAQSASVLRLPAPGLLDLSERRVEHEGKVTCRAHNLLGSLPVLLSLSVHCKPESRAGQVLGVFGGAGIMALALLSLCLCLIFRVKTCRDRATQLMQSVDKDVNPGSGSSSCSGAHQRPFRTASPSAPPAPGRAGPLANGEQDLHYAVVRFHNQKPQGTEDASIVYSEIKTRK